MQNSRLPDDRRLAPKALTAAEAIPAAFLNDLSELLFASRDLARMQFTSPPQRTRSGPIAVCVECRCEQYATLTFHAAGCRTGRTARILLKLIDLDFHEFLSQSTTIERRLSEERDKPRSSAERTGAPFSAARSPQKPREAQDAAAADGGAR